jgi:excisionase family DNA binding protein
MQTCQPKTVSAKDAARLIGVGKTKFFQLVAEGKLRAVRLGLRKVYRVKDLEQFVNNLKPAR